MCEWTMAVRSRLPILIAELNLQRAQQGLKALSARQLAEAMDIQHTRFLRLMNGGEAWKLDVMDKIVQYFQLISFDQLFEYKEEQAH